MIEEWAATLEKWRTDPEVAVIVLTGAGGDFCSGVDFSSAGDPMQAGPYEMKHSALGQSSSHSFDPGGHR